VLQKLKDAFARRKALRSSPTNALRLVDGDIDGFPEIEIDDFAGRWLISTRQDDIPRVQDIAKAALELGATSVYLKQRGDKTAPTHLGGETAPDPFVILENDLRYEIDYRTGYSQGIFLDQRDNRLAIRQMSNQREVLNCFAYTCAFGVSAASGGAHTVNLDLSKSYLTWGRRNYALNGLDDNAHDFLFGDVFEWLRRFAKKGRRFDIVILDPPTFSRDAKGKVFRVEDDFGELVSLAESVLADHGTILATTNQRSLFPATFESLARSGLSNPDAWQITRKPMPPDFRGDPYLKTLWFTR